MDSISSLSSYSIDIDQLVSSYMSVQRQPIKRLTAQKDQWSAKLEVYTSVEASLSALEELAEELSDASATSVLNAKIAASSDEQVLTATADSNAAVGSYLFRIKQLATATVLRTGRLGNSGSVRSSRQVVPGFSRTLDMDESFSDAGFAKGVPDGSVTINGIPFNLGDYETVRAFVEAVNNNKDAHANMYYNNTEDRFVVESNDPSMELILSEEGTHPFFSAVHIEPGTYTESVSGIQSDVLLYEANFDRKVAEEDAGSFMINGATIEWDASEDTLTDIIARINTSTADVTAFYDDSLDRLILLANNTGNEEITFEDVEGTFLSDTLKFAEATQTLGLDARFTMNSMHPEDEIVKSSNTFEINGTTYTLQSTNVEDYSEAAYVGVTVTQDIQALREKVQEFITQFNETINAIKAKLAVDTTTYTRGALAGNSTYAGLRRSLISAVASEVSGIADGDPNYLYEIGIDLTNDLQLEMEAPSALTDALNDDAGGVVALVSGVARQITELIAPFTEEDGIIDQNREWVNEQVSTIDDRVSSLEAQLSNKEVYYRRRLASMQQALNMASQRQTLLDSIWGNLG